MREFSSYYFAKANEIPQSNYIDVAYFEAIRNNSNKVQQALPSVTKQQKQSLNKFSTKSLGRSL